jgi:hypothetical protein
MKKIRNLLYQIGQLDFQEFNKKKLKHAKGDHLHKGVNS